MSKKGPKKDTAKSKKTETPTVVPEESEPWITELKNLVINDETWSSNVCMLVEQNSDNLLYVKALHNVFSSGQNLRPFTKILSNQSLAVNTIENSYNINIHSFSNAYKKLLDTALVYCSAEGFTENIPISILASLIKYYIYNLKLKNIAEIELIEAYKQKLQKARDGSILGIQKCIGQSGPTSKDKSSGKKSAKEKQATASSKKTGKEKPDDTKVTRLRKRGEEILDSLEMQSDVPDDGPQLYIIMHSFHNAQLPLELLKLEVPLIALVKLHNFCMPDGELINEIDSKTISQGLNTVCKELTIRQRRLSDVKEEFNLNGSALDLFWKKFFEILNDNHNVPLFKDTVFMKFYPKLYNHQDLNKKKKLHEVYVEIQKSIYTQLCHLQYDIQDVKRQHINYVSHLIPCDVLEKQILDIKDMTLYNKAVSSIPPEIINIPFILDCILIQVEDLMIHGKESPVNELPKTADVLEGDAKVENGNLEKKLQELDVTHDLFELFDVVKEKEANPFPLVILYGDEIEMKSHWCDKNDDLKRITCNVLQCYWEQYLCRNLPAYEDVISFDELQHTDLFSMLKGSGDITVRDRLCNMPCLFGETEFVVENKPSVFCTDNDKETWTDKVQSYCNYRCSDLESTSLKHHVDPNEGRFLGQIYDQHSYCFEEMTSDILLLNLFDSSEHFNCRDLFQDYFKGRLFIKFHHNKSCCKEEYLLGTLRTKTALRDFYDYTIDEELYWLNEQEFVYDRFKYKEEMKSLRTALNKLEYLKDKVSYMTKLICEETNFLVPHTLKNSGGDTPELVIIPSYTLDEAPHSNDFSHFLHPSHLETFDIDLPYRVQFSEKRQEFIVSENSKLLVKRMARLYKDESVMIQATVHGHSLFMNHIIGSPVNNSLHLIHQSGIILHIKRNETENSILQASNISHDVNEITGTAAINKIIDYGEPSDDVFLKPLIYQLCVTLPSTLCLEIINPLDTTLYVKQHYLFGEFLPQEIQEEECRCYLTDGKLIKFMRNGTITIYYHDGQIFDCEIVQPAATVETVQPSATIDTTTAVITKVVQKTAVSVKGKPQDSKPKKTAKKEEPTEPPQSLPKERKKTAFKYIQHTQNNGEVILFKDGQQTKLEPLFFSTFTDIFNGVIVSERTDGTVLTYNREGTLFVDFPEGSRITTKSWFDTNEILLDRCEEVDEAEPGRSASEHVSDELDEMEEYCIEEEEQQGEGNNKYKSCQEEGFLVVHIQHYYEHKHYASVVTDLNKEEINIHFPCNVDVSLTSEGLYTIRLSEHAQIITEYDRLLFNEINSNNRPEFTVHLLNKQHDTTPKVDINTSNENGTKPVGSTEADKDTHHDTRPKVDINTSNENGTKPVGSAEAIENSVILDVLKTHSTSEATTGIIFSCKDDVGNELTVDENGVIETISEDGVNNICKCDSISYDRVFIFNTEYNGLEMFPPGAMESIDNETKKIEKSVAQNYGTVDHNVLLQLIPLTQNERERWWKPLTKIEYCPLYVLPSTYNDQHTSYNPFPKHKKLPTPVPPPYTPDVLLIRVINRVNCNIHLLEQTFLHNKQITDLLRSSRCGELALQLYQRGDVQLCKADKAFVEYIRHVLLGSLIARTRRRVVKRLEVRKTKEYIEILTKKLLLPYFDSAQGATFVILLDIILSTVQICSEDRNKLEKLFSRPLHQLTDDDLEYMHDRIAPLTVTRFCSCDDDSAFCRLRVLLLAGRTLHGILPDMMTVFHAFGSVVRKNRKAEMLMSEVKPLLYKPSDTLSEDEILLLHNELRTLPVMTAFCTCSTSAHELNASHKNKCKLMAILIACVTLSYIFTNVDSVFKAYKIDINL